MTKLKSKKITKSTLAVIIMAIAVVALLAFGGTFAFFTATANTASSNVIFGKVDLALGDVEIQSGTLVNGDQIFDGSIEYTANPTVKSIVIVRFEAGTATAAFTYPIDSDFTSFGTGADGASYYYAVLTATGSQTKTFLDGALEVSGLHDYSQEEAEAFDACVTFLATEIADSSTLSIADNYTNSEDTTNYNPTFAGNWAKLSATNKTKLTAAYNGGSGSMTGVTYRDSSDIMGVAISINIQARAIQYRGLGSTPTTDDTDVATVAPLAAAVLFPGYSA